MLSRAIWFFITECSPIAISPAPGVTMNAADSVTISCDVTCSVPQSVTLYKNSDSVETVAIATGSFSFSVTLNKEDNGVIFYCDIDGWQNVRSSETSFLLL